MCSINTYHEKGIHVVCVSNTTKSNLFFHFSFMSEPCGDTPEKTQNDLHSTNILLAKYKSVDILEDEKQNKISNQGINAF